MLVNMAAPADQFRLLIQQVTDFKVQHEYIVPSNEVECCNKIKSVFFSNSKYIKHTHTSASIYKYKSHLWCGKSFYFTFYFST